MKFMSVFMLALCLPLLCGCAHTPMSIPGDTLAQARELGFTYERNVDLALDGDSEAIENLLVFSDKLDASGAEGHYEVLRRIAESIGENKFATIMNDMTGDVKNRLEIEMMRDFLYQNEDGLFVPVNKR